MSLHAFEYAALRVVPRMDRGESINAGVLLYCQSLEFLDSRIHLARDRLFALDPGADVDGIVAALESAADVCSADPGAGAAGLETAGRRFRWLTAPRSTAVQAGPVHTGLTADPAADLERLLRVLVLPLAGGPVSDPPGPAE